MGVREEGASWFLITRNFTKIKLKLNFPQSSGLKARYSLEVSNQKVLLNFHDALVGKLMLKIQTNAPH